MLPSILINKYLFKTFKCDAETSVYVYFYGSIDTRQSLVVV
jgi:hypothetical protein